MARPVISLQLYTVRDHTNTDMLGALRRIAKIGYEGVELAGYGNASRDDVISTLQETGLKVTGAHVGLEALQNDFKTVVSDSRALGNTFVIVPFLSEQYRGSREGWQETGELLDGIGRMLRNEGLTLCYHNHDFEVKEKYGEGAEADCALDVLYQTASPENLKAEIDCYWLEKGGKDAAAYIRKLAGRVPLVHLKDMGTDGSFKEVGEGSLSFPNIFNAAEEGDVQAYVVEQDVCPGDPFDSVKISLENLRDMGKLGSE